MKWLKVRYVDSDGCINTVEIGSESGDLSVQDATDAIRETLENDGIYVQDIAVVDIKRKGWFG